MTLPQPYVPSHPRSTNWVFSLTSERMVRQDLVEHEGKTFLIWNWGCQLASEALVIGVSPMPLDAFLAAWF